jgi:hypothetical protein
LKIAEEEFLTEKSIEADAHYTRWNHRFQPATLKLPYSSIADIGFLFVYLMLGDKPICYYKCKIEEFMDPNPIFRWIQLLNDQAIGKIVESHKAGMISFKLSIHDVTKNGSIDFMKYDSWRRPVPKRITDMKARVYIF